MGLAYKGVSGIRKATTINCPKAQNISIGESPICIDTGQTKDQLACKNASDASVLEPNRYQSHFYRSLLHSKKCNTRVSIYD